MTDANTDNLIENNKDIDTDTAREMILICLQETAKELISRRK